MVSVTLAVPNDLREKMKEHDEINWSAFIRKQIEKKTQEIQEAQELKEQLKQEEAFDTWAVKQTRAGRKGRLEELKKKGLL